MKAKPSQKRVKSEIMKKKFEISVFYCSIFVPAGLFLYKNISLINKALQFKLNTCIRKSMDW